jgi:hypothetical protein
MAMHILLFPNKISGTTRSCSSLLANLSKGGVPYATPVHMLDTGPFKPDRNISETYMDA